MQVKSTRLVVLLLLLGIVTPCLSAPRNLGPKYWPYHAEGCMNARDLYLAKSSLTTNIKFTKRGQFDCHIESGKWVDYFTEESIKDANEVILAPAIPIQHINLVTKVKWDLQKFHGYVHDEESFITFKVGSIGEQRYLNNVKTLLARPDDYFHGCELAGKWLDSKIRWDIPFSEGEKENLVKVAFSCITSHNYRRDIVYGGWRKDADKECNTRVEVLVKNSLIPTTPLEKFKNIPCTPKLQGKWHDPYSDTDFDLAEVLDIDHIVPLKNAYNNGTWKWPYWKKRNYANDMINPFHLIPVSASENRSKSDSAPNDYLPPNDSFKCEYIELWVQTKLRWVIKLESEELSFIKNEITSCGDTINKEEILEALNLLQNQNPW